MLDLSMCTLLPLETSVSTNLDCTEHSREVREVWVLLSSSYSLYSSRSFLVAQVDLKELRVHIYHSYLCLYVYFIEPTKVHELLCRGSVSWREGAGGRQGK